MLKFLRAFVLTMLLSYGSYILIEDFSGVLAGVIEAQIDGAFESISG